MKNQKIHLADLYASRHILFRLVAQQLILRYRRTALGFLWTLINPLMMMSVMALVFAQLFKEDLKAFAITLFAGMIPWNFFSSVVSQSTTAYINNEGLIKKIYIPKMIFPLSIACGLLIDAALSFVALFIIILTLGGNISWALLFLPVSFLLLFVFSFGVALIVSIATVYFRDVQHIVLIFLQGLFFLTPVLYKPDSLSGKVVWLIDINPVTPFIALFKMPLTESIVPTEGLVLKAALITLLAISLGLFLYARLQKKIIFRL
ncbi:ABC transporter permease [Polynucleobacter paneuropaeus]|nr:ABC transporter permease [Polynucleobacter paneuropaeus]